MYTLKLRLQDRWGLVYSSLFRFPEWQTQYFTIYSTLNQDWRNLSVRFCKCLWVEKESLWALVNGADNCKCRKHSHLGSQTCPNKTWVIMYINVFLETQKIHIICIFFFSFIQTRFTDALNNNIHVTRLLKKKALKHFFFLQNSISCTCSFQA